MKEATFTRSERSNSCFFKSEILAPAFKLKLPKISSGSEERVLLLDTYKIPPPDLKKKKKDSLIGANPWKSGSEGISKGKYEKILNFGKI